MRRRVTALAAVFALLASAAGATAIRTGERAAAARAHAARAAAEARVRDGDIEFYRGRVARDRYGAADRARLAQLYLRRARETGDNGDLLRAEATARVSLALRTGRNGAACVVLATSLLSQHRFVDAHDAAAALVGIDSTSVSARALLAETALELGRYAEAGRLLAPLRIYQADLTVAPRLARWAELRGDPTGARRLLRLAREEAERRHAMPAEQLAWFHLRAGDLALRYGHRAEAEDELRAGLAASPEDHRLLAAMARLAAARADWRGAADYGERAVARLLDPATLGLVSDAYRALGDTARQREYARAMELSVLQQPGPFHRAWSLFLLDHRREVPAVLANVQAELRTRRDVYGYDLLAWALHRSGRDTEAREPMARALALGTRDPQLLAHAAAIRAALERRGR